MIKQNTLFEGGAVGHLMHLYDNPDITFGEIKDLLFLASEGKLQKVSEKIDGMNLVITWDLESDTLRAARNSGNIKGGGMSFLTLSEKFQGRGDLSNAFESAFKVLDSSIRQISEKDKRIIFGNSESRFWYSTEIIYSKNPNVINYDKDYVVFHGWPVFQSKGDEISRVDNSVGVDLLSERISEIQKSNATENWSVSGPALLQLKKKSSGQHLTKALDRINQAMNLVGVTDSDTIEQYMISYMLKSMPDIEASDDVKQKIALRASKSKGAPTLTTIKSLVSPDDYKDISQFIANSDSLAKEAIFPIEKGIHDFSVEVLNGLKSTLLSDNESEIQRLRSEVEKAISAIENSQDENMLTILKKNLEKLESIENINSAMEGVVFIYKGNAYKFTGSFAPVNQILGLFKYGRGKSKPPQKMTESDQKAAIGNSTKRVVATFPGRFQPWHIGHKRLFDTLSQKFGTGNSFIVTSSKTGPKSPFTINEKLKLFKATGISSSRIINADNPYKVDSVLGKIQAAPENTIYICAISEKDMNEDPRFSMTPKKDGSPSYFQIFKSLKNCESADRHGYLITLPTIDFEVLGETLKSATQLRKMYRSVSDEQKKQIISTLYGSYDDAIKKLFDDKIMSISERKRRK